MRNFVILSSLLSASLLTLHAEPKSMFDGKTLEGWEGLPALWRVEDGAITGGSKTMDVTQNEFLATKKEYGNFVLRLKFKLTGFGGFVNSGIQIRSQRVPNSGEMAGYQCDLGDPTWWGCIYDESRRNRVMAQSDMTKIEPVLKRDDWNDYEILADGPRIRTVLNGVTCVDYIEEDPTIVQTGHIGIQVHGGGKPWMQVKDITIEELPPTKPAPAFQEAPEPAPPAKASPLSGAEQQKMFTLPPGFSIELVAEEAEGYGKFITTTWDTAGRLWTMTAMEYPVDANENRPSAEALYASHAKDKVLVYDFADRGGHGKPATYKATPSIFADGLAIPLGLLPHKDGAIVQHGTKIVFLRDTNGDGKADKSETLLDGVGIDDSHLFLHGFTRGPGGWIYTAQGAFNHSQIKAKDGSVTKWDFCKLGRFTPDGQKFELVAAGLNNIWGFVIDRESRLYGQEANDMGYPLTPMEVGENFPGIGEERLKPYGPVRPPAVTDWQVGGTGLSGLALADDIGTWPKPYGMEEDPRHRMFYLANPITNRIQATQGIGEPHREKFSKVKDFVRCSDPWFRPVHITFGPDGCLYIVDWYNKIISHNEVPRNFPERDKTRGRIWRVRHAAQPAVTVPDLSKMDAASLTAQLNSPIKWSAQTAAWLLEQSGAPVPANTNLVWQDRDRRAAFRKASVADLLQQTPAADGSYETNFVRGLIREALEMKQEDLAAFLDSPEARKISAENRLFACVALPEAISVLRLASLLPAVDRPLRDDELLPMAAHAGKVEVQSALGALLKRRENVELLLRLKTKFEAAALKPVLTKVAQEWLTKDPGLAIQLAAGFQIAELEPAVAASLEKAGENEIPVLLRALWMLGSKRQAVFEKFATSEVPAIQNEALRGLVATPELLLARWEKLSPAQQQSLSQELASIKPGAQALIAAVTAKQIGAEVIDGPLVERLQAVLGEADPQLQSLLNEFANLFQSVLMLNGDEACGAEIDLTLEGPFTVEAWIKIDGEISNADGLLAGAGNFDFNFYGGIARVFAGPLSDVIVAKKPMTPGMWSHVAATRDEQGNFKIYQHGELDNAEGKPDKTKYEHLTLGHTTAAGGTNGAMAEFRVWNVCRTPGEIRTNFDRTLIGQKVPGLVACYSGSQWPKLRGPARIAKTTDFPALSTPEQAKALDEKFAKFVALAQKQGDPAQGKLIANICITCHQIQGAGGQIGPNLSGVGAMGLDAILRNVLTPNAAMEAGYRVYQVVMNDGRVLEGFLAKQEETAYILRVPGAEDQRIPKNAVLRSQYLKRSLMPEGLLDAFPPEMVTDLMTYLQSLK